jgi:glycosyltransferase involved in cell wall biosynthesis
MPYSIILPVHNEEKHIPKLLSELEPYASRHEILVVDDGSTDGSLELLQDCSFITLVNLNQNSGKGAAFREGLTHAKYNKIILTDGDLELDPAELDQLMILDDEEPTTCVFGTRYLRINPFHSILDLGNFFFTGLFNFIHQKNLTDALCCAKAFFKSQVDPEQLKSIGFDIDVELAAILVNKNVHVREIPLTYTRRDWSEGKKLRLKDGWSILRRIVKS